VCFTGFSDFVLFQPIFEAKFSSKFLLLLLKYILVTVAQYTKIYFSTVTVA